MYLICPATPHANHSNQLQTRIYDKWLFTLRTELPSVSARYVLFSISIQGLSSYSATIYVAQLYPLLLPLYESFLACFSGSVLPLMQLRIFGKGLYHLLPVRLQPINWPIGALPRDCMLRGQYMTVAYEVL